VPAAAARCPWRFPRTEGRVQGAVESRRKETVPAAFGGGGKGLGGKTRKKTHTTTLNSKQNQTRVRRTTG